MRGLEINICETTFPLAVNRARVDCPIIIIFSPALPYDVILNRSALPYDVILNRSALPYDVILNRRICITKHVYVIFIVHFTVQLNFVDMLY